MGQGTLKYEGAALPRTAVAAITAGDVVQVADGRAGVIPSAASAGELTNPAVKGVFKILKTANIVLLAGGRAYFDVSAGTATYRAESGTGDFYLGTVVADAAAADTYVLVALNEQQNNTISLHGDHNGWISESALGLGVTVLPGGGLKLEFDAVAEVAQAAAYSNNSVLITSKPIMEFKAAVFGIGDNAALDIDIGLATGSHASDFQSVTEFAAVHLDGNDLSVLLHSDDGTTDTAPVDSTLNLTDDTYAEFWIDARDLSDVKFYMNGVDIGALAATTFDISAATGAVKPVIMIEKTSDDTVADVRLVDATVRTISE